MLLKPFVLFFFAQSFSLIESTIYVIRNKGKFTDMDLLILNPANLNVSTKCLK